MNNISRHAALRSASKAGASLPMPAIAAAHMSEDPEVKALEPFAHAWLSQWTSMGGSCMPDPRTAGGWILGRPEYDLSPAYDDDRAAHGWTEDQQHYQAYAHARYDGQMRALRELLRTVRSGRDAVQALVTVDPQLGRMRARKAVL